MPELYLAYFEPSEVTPASTKKDSGLRPGEAPVHQQKVGESLADKFDKMD